jgi:hypothetical protein
MEILPLPENLLPVQENNPACSPRPAAMCIPEEPQQPRQISAQTLEASNARQGEDGPSFISLLGGTRAIYWTGITQTEGGAGDLCLPAGLDGLGTSTKIKKGTSMFSMIAIWLDNSE